MVKFYRIKQIIPEIFPVARTTFLSWVKENPDELTPVKLGQRTTVWTEDQLKNFAEKHLGSGSSTPAAQGGR